MNCEKGSDLLTRNTYKVDVNVQSLSQNLLLSFIKTSMLHQCHKKLLKADIYEFRNHLHLGKTLHEECRQSRGLKLKIEAYAVSLAKKSCFAEKYQICLILILKLYKYFWNDLTDTTVFHTSFHCVQNILNNASSLQC